MKIQYLGHSSFLINFGGKNLLFDPFISGNPLAAELKLEEIVADYVIITHGHGDHVADAESIAKNNNAPIIANYEIAEWYSLKGLKTYGLNIGGKCNFEFGTLKLVTAIHSSVLPDGTYGGNPYGIVIWDDNNCFYHAGDTALTLDMQLIPKICPPLDFAILPVGDYFTMGYEDAIIAADFIECNKIYGCHFDSFPFIKIDHSKAKKAFAEANKDLILLEIGQETTV
jgi:L-ascorbate metabolism protein UlaG (beta-lactamase superfamily)